MDKVRYTKGTNNTLPLANTRPRLGAQTLSLTDDGPKVPSTPAAKFASKQMNPNITSEPDSEVHQPGDKGIEMAKENNSSKAEIETRPVEMPTGQADENSDEPKEDSFVEQIKSRSPAKRVSRIEDSVEALDKLEEDIEKAGQAITPPPVADGLPAPSGVKASGKTTESGKTVSKAKGKSVEGVSKGQNAVPAKVVNRANKPVKRASVRPADFKPKENRASLLRQGIKPVSPIRAERPATTKKASAPREAMKAPAPAARRVSSVTKAPFQPAKSTKAPTQSTFELPGEAISRKLKEQREERLKREEEEKSKRQSFKARPGKCFFRAILAF